MTTKVLTKKEKDKSKNFYTKLLTRRYSKEELENDSSLKLPNNTTFNLIEDDIFYKSVISAIYFVRGSCSLDTLLQYLISFSNSRIEFFKSSKNQVNFNKYKQLNSQLNDVEVFRQKINELLYLKLISLSKEETAIMLTPNSKSYVTQKSNNGSYDDFDNIKIQKGDFFLRICIKLNLFHHRECIFNKALRDKAIKDLVKNNFNTISNTFKFTNEVANKHDIYSLDSYINNSSLSAEDKRYILSKEIENMIVQAELKNAYAISYDKGVAAINIHTNKKVSDKTIISSLKALDFINFDGAKNLKDKRGYFDSDFSLYKLSKIKFVFIDKLHKDTVLNLLNKEQGLKHTLETNNIRFEFI